MSSYSDPLNAADPLNGVSFLELMQSAALDRLMPASSPGQQHALSLFLIHCTVPNDDQFHQELVDITTFTRAFLRETDTMLEVGKADEFVVFQPDVSGVSAMQFARLVRSAI